MKNIDLGYTIPSDWNTEELACFRVYVPKHTLFLGAFWNAYEFFTTWIAWARDPFHTGKSVAALWRTAYNLARAQYELSKGVCMSNITDMRIDPLDPCRIQVQLDGGSEWVDKLDISACGAGCGGGSGTAVRFNGNNIQRYDPCDNTWKDAGPSADPRFDQTASGQYAGVECGNGIASANLARVIEDSKNLMCERVGAVANFSVILTELLAGMSAIWGFSFAVPIISFLTDAWAYLQTHYTDVAAFDLYEALSPILPTYFEPDGSMTKAQYDSMLVRLNNIYAEQTDPSGARTAYGYAIAWVTAAGPVGCVKANKSGNVATFDCTDTEWEETFDLTVSRYAFFDTATYGGSPSQEWVSGVGFRSVFRHIDGIADVNVLNLAIAFAQRPVTYIETLYDNHNGTFSIPPGPNWQYADNSGFATPFVSGSLSDGTDIRHVVTSDTGFLLSTLAIEYLPGFDNTFSGDTGGVTTLKFLKLRGKGSNPFNTP